MAFLDGSGDFGTHLGERTESGKERECRAGFCHKLCFPPECEECVY